MRRHPLALQTALRGNIEVVLTDYTRDGQLPADVVWARPTGNFHFEVGLKFRKLSRNAQPHRCDRHRTPLPPGGVIEPASANQYHARHHDKAPSCLMGVNGCWFSWGWIARVDALIDFAYGQAPER